MKDLLKFYRSFGKIRSRLSFRHFRYIKSKHIVIKPIDMSLLTRAFTTSQIVVNVSLSVACVFMSYFWYQNAQTSRDSRKIANDEHNQRVKFMDEECARQRDVKPLEDSTESRL